MIESDDEDEDDKSGSGGGGGGHRIVEERIVEGDGVPMDLLDSKSSMQLVAREGRRSKDKGKQDLDLDANGRMIVPMDEEDDDDSKHKGGGHDDDNSEEDEDGRAKRSINSKSSKQTSETTNRPSKRQKSKTEDDGTTGARFRSNKAGGDVRRKGDKSLPFAYVQMGSGFLNRRQKHQNVRKFEAISSAAQRGAMKGSKNKRKR
jgi:ribosomal RNA-processing protein 12